MGALHRNASCFLLHVILLLSNGAFSSADRKTNSLVAISTCAQLKEALEQAWPPTNILVANDIVCNKEIWGSPVTVKLARTIMGIRTQPATVPNIDFGDVDEGIVVEDKVRLKFETLSLMSSMPSDPEEGQEAAKVRPLSALKVHQNATIDFVGVLMCCPGCMMGPSESQVYINQRPTEDLIEQGVDPDGTANLNVGDSTTPSENQTGDTFIKWFEGKFDSGGTYHMCATATSCNNGSSTQLAFIYFMDHSIDVCQSNPTVVILNQTTSKGDHMPMLVAVLVISVSTPVCLILVGIAVLLVKLNKGVRRQTRGLREISHVSADTRDTEGGHAFRGEREEGWTGLNESSVQHDQSALNLSGTSFDFSGVHVDLTKLIGRGGFSTVYEGTYQGAKVAIKVVEHNPKLLANGTGELAEVHLHHNLTHPSIVRTYCSKTVPVDSVHPSSSVRSSPTISIEADRSSSSGKPQVVDSSSNAESSAPGSQEAMCTMIVMEYCEKGNLFQAIHNRELFRSGLTGVPDLTVILQSALDVASAMRYLHAQGFVHGDLKPENVLRKALAEDDRGYICKVTDFGLSRAVPIDTFLQTATHGTITHMPPEVLRDGILGPAVDVYSFAIMLWEMLSGNIPFKGQGHHDIILGVVAGNRPMMPNNIPRGMSALIEDCWRDDPSRRPTFAQIIGSLQGIIYDVQQHLTAPFSRLVAPSPRASLPPASDEWFQNRSKSVLSSTTPTNTPRHSSTTPTSVGSPVIWDCVHSPTPTSQEPQLGSGGMDLGGERLWCSSVCGAEHQSREALSRAGGSEKNAVEVPWKAWNSHGMGSTEIDFLNQPGWPNNYEVQPGHQAKEEPAAVKDQSSHQKEEPSRVVPVTAIPKQSDMGYEGHGSFSDLIGDRRKAEASKGQREWNEGTPSYPSPCLEVAWDAIHPHDPAWNAQNVVPQELTSGVTTVSTYDTGSEQRQGNGIAHPHQVDVKARLKKDAVNQRVDEGEVEIGDTVLWSLPLSEVEDLPMV